MTKLAFPLPRPLLFLYAALAIAFSVALLALSRERGSDEFAGWLVAYLGLAALAWRRPGVAPLVAGFAAFLFGFVRTYRGGANLDLGLGLIALSVGLSVLSRASRGRQGTATDLTGISLFAIAAWSVVSLGFTVARIRAFAPAPGFGYHTYPFNPLGFSSDEAIVRSVIGAAAVFVWFGLYDYTRSVELHRKALNVAVFVALLVNATTLVVQRYFDPRFLLPAGLPQPIGRLNGATSFCYALGDVMLALLLLLPAWGFARGPFGLLTGGSLVLVTHAIIASGSRVALLTVLFAAVLWIGLRAFRLARRGRRGPALGAAGAIVALLGMAGATYVITPPDPTSPVGRLKEAIERQGVIGHLFATRLSTYPLLFRVIAEYPLSGVGVGLYVAEASKQRALLAPHLEITDPYLRATYAPNQLLNTGVELGLPAMTALAVAFVAAAAAAFSRARPDSADRLVSLLALGGALQFGPAFYNSEALVFCWLIVGLAAREGGEPGNPPHPGRTVAPRASRALIAGAVAIGVVGHLLSWSSLAVARQWDRLRWRINIGMQPPEAGGQWSGPEGTFSVKTTASRVIVRWHAGDASARDYHAEVSFYVDGTLAQRVVTSGGRMHETVLVVPSAPGFKRITVRVSPPFVPPAGRGGNDDRRLGVFIHSVKPVGSDLRDGTTGGNRS